MTRNHCIGWRRFLFSAVTLLLLSQLNGCGCGFDCNSESTDPTTGTLSLGLSDAPLDDATEVVLVLDSITLRGASIEDVVIDTFTVAELDAEEADSISVDLLQFPGLSQLLIVTDQTVAAGSYTALELAILDGDVNQSYVSDLGGQKTLNATDSTLTLPGLTVSGDSDQTWTIEVSLGQSLSYDSTTDSYTLSTQGMRVVDNSTSASIGGSISTDLFSTGATCSAKTEPLAGNRVYLYSGHDLDVADLADVHTASSSGAVPATAIAPLTLTKPFENAAFARWDYIIGYLPAGDYTLAFSCAAEDDNPIEYDGFEVPSPESQVYEISLQAATTVTCDLADGATCS